MPHAVTEQQGDSVPLGCRPRAGGACDSGSFAVSTPSATQEHLVLCRRSVSRRTQLVGDVRRVPGDSGRAWVWPEGGTQPLGFAEQGMVVPGHAQGFPRE